MTERDSKEIFRDFIYIDKDRMYSLYSQIFKGVVESLAESISYSKEDTEKKKNLEETIIDASVKVQNIVLFDHIYNTLEEKLQPHMLVINELTTREDIKPSSLIKVTGYTVVEDYEHLLYLMQNFNDIGMAIATLNLKNIEKNKDQISKNSIDQYAKNNGLFLDKKFTESVVKIIQNFHGNSMEISLELDDGVLDACFKAFLDQKYLRISNNSIRTLYGHRPCMKWTLVGEVTNVMYQSNDRIEKNKTLFSKMFDSLSDVDNLFYKVNGFTNNIIRVAPIAVYIEHGK